MRLIWRQCTRQSTQSWGVERCGEQSPMPFLARSLSVYQPAARNIWQYAWPRRLTSIALRAELDVLHSQAVSCTADDVLRISTELHSLPEQLQYGRPLF